ncbi:hypothetical protein AB0B45_16460 [Nonomuraea sp. NPDC049152]|uniref:P-type ATPase n=1 Tax=Nonomuraea sp. NPDC049152 TaxID=3154350 RepID=UPI0033EA678B
MEGLTSAQVAVAKRNTVPRRTSRSLPAIIRANVLTLFNLVIGVLWALILIFGEWQDSLFGLVIVANAMIGIVQELRAKRTLDQLAVVNEVPVTVRRDGRDQRIRPGQIVLGDLILLGPGDRLLVDGEVVAAEWLEIDESLLTGEADPVHKQPGDQVLSGSFVVAGSGAFTATKVGEDAYAARLTKQASRFFYALAAVARGRPARHGVPVRVNALTIGVPAFFLALAPTAERSLPGFVPCVLRFAVPAGLIAGAGVILSFSAAGGERTAAVVTLFLVTWWVLVLIARPLNTWKIALIGAMAALFALALAIPSTRAFFELGTGGWAAVAIAVAASAGISAAVKLTGTLRT